MKPLPVEPGLAHEYPAGNTFGAGYEREEGGLGLGGMDGGAGAGGGFMRGLSGESEVNPEYTPR